MNCKQCNGVMTIDQNNNLFRCPYCGSVELFNNVSKEELAKAINAVKNENRQMVSQIVKSNRDTLNAVQTGSTIKNTFITIFLTLFLIVVLVFTIFAFDTGYYVAGIISTIQLILVIISFILIFKRTHLGFIFAIISVILALPWFIALGAQNDVMKSQQEKKEWVTSGLGYDLPKTDHNISYISNSDKYFTATINDVTLDEFNDYVDKCKALGYTIDVTSKEGSYIAYNEKDDELKLNWYHDKDLSIWLSKALEYTEFYWPKSGGLQFVPAPESDIISVESISETSARLYVGNVSRTYMIKFIDEVNSAGFTGSYNAENDSYYGEYNDVRLKIQLLRNRIMYFDIYIYKEK